MEILLKSLNWYHSVMKEQLSLLKAINLKIIASIPLTLLQWLNLEDSLRGDLIKMLKICMGDSLRYLEILERFAKCLEC